MLSFRGSLSRQPARKAASCLLILAVAFMGLTPPPCRAQVRDDQVAALQTQIIAIDLKIDQAESELAAVGNPNWCCGCGLMAVLLLAPGMLIWYFTDIKPKEDRKHEISDRINRLQEEKLNLRNQILLLRTEK